MNRTAKTTLLALTALAALNAPAWAGSFGSAKTSSSLTSGNSSSSAAVDCSIECHPDCPRSGGGSGHKKWSDLLSVGS